MISDKTKVRIMPDSDSKLSLSVQMFTVSDWAVVGSEILAISWLRDMTDHMLLPNQSAFADFHNMSDVTSEEVFAADYDKP